MDRDAAQLLLTKLTNIKTALQNIATNTSPTIIERSAPADDQRSAPEEIREQDPEPDPEPNKK